MSDLTEQGPVFHDTPAEKDLLIRAMEAAGYTFDGLESTDDHLRFFGEGGQTMTMGGWQECEAWLNGVVFDDPNITAQVEQILQPSRFSGAAISAATGTRTLEDQLEQNDNQLDGIVNNMPAQPMQTADPMAACREASEAADRDSVLKKLQDQREHRPRPERSRLPTRCIEERCLE